MAYNNAANYNVTGMVSTSSSGVAAGRTITGTANQTSVTNGDGTGGNPTIALTSTIQVSGISFDSGSNSLTAYSEGTWTPALSRTSINISYNSQVGRYTRIGNRVFLGLVIQVNVVTNAGSGNTTVTGLPFTVSASASSASGLYETFCSFVNFPAGLHYLSGIANISATTVNLWMNGGATLSSQAITPVASRDINMVGIYEV